MTARQVPELLAVTDVLSILVVRYLTENLSSVTFS